MKPMVRFSSLFWATAAFCAVLGELGLPAQQMSTLSHDLYLRDLTRVAGEAILDPAPYKFVSDLSDGIGPRLTGSPGNEKAMEWALGTMRSIGLANVHRENFSIWRGWSRGTAQAELISPSHRKLMVDSMGWVGSTVPGGIDADVIQIDLSDVSLDSAFSENTLRGRIIEVTQKGSSPDRGVITAEFDSLLNAAVSAHAIAVISGQNGKRSEGVKLTHTGILGVGKAYDIPVVSMAEEDQEELDRLFESGKTPRIHIEVRNTLGDAPVQTANIIGEIPGTLYPQEIVVVSGHLDSWDLAQGATDDGCGVATALGAANAILSSGAKPLRTIRFILFNAEEQGMLGSSIYVREHESTMKDHLVDINLDAGQGPVTGFNLNGRDDLLTAFNPAQTLLGPMGVEELDSWPVFGADTGPFTLSGVPGIMLEQSDKDYKITHHSSADTLDKVRETTLNQNTAIEATLAFWVASQPSRIAQPWPAERTRQMLVERHQDRYLKAAGLWKF